MNAKFICTLPSGHTGDHNLDHVLTQGCLIGKCGAETTKEIPDIKPFTTFTLPRCKAPFPKIDFSNSDDGTDEAGIFISNLRKKLSM